MSCSVSCIVATFWSIVQVCKYLLWSYDSRHLSRTPLWWFLKSTPWTCLYDRYFKWIVLSYLFDKCVGNVPCSINFHRSEYHGTVDMDWGTCSILYISISFFHLEISYFGASLALDVSVQSPWPIMVWIGLNSRSYSCKQVI